MQVEKLIDYLSFNTLTIPSWLRIASHKPSFMANYETMSVCECGATIHYGSKSTEKYKVIMSGSQCRDWQMEFGVQGFVDIVSNTKPSVTRLDLAITQYIDHDGLLTVPDIHAYYQADMIDSKHVKHGSTYLESDKISDDEKIEKSGVTMYIGDWKRRAKHGIFRAYDKGLEMNLDDYMITRLEVEDKRKDAQVSFNRLKKGASVAQVFQSRFNVSDDYFQALLDCEPMDITRGKSAKEQQGMTIQDESFKKWGWLIGTCAPAMGKQIAKDHANNINDEEFQKEFWEAVQKAYQGAMNEV